MYKYNRLLALVLVFLMGANVGVILAKQTTKPVAESTPETVELIIIEPEEEVETVTYYDVPLDYGLQEFIMYLGKIYDIDPAIIVAMIERESGYDPESVGDNGNSLGLMQVQERYHADRMKELGCTNLLNPHNNIMVGVNYLIELRDKYEGDLNKALMAYNAGAAGAYENWFSKGVYNNEYSEYVVAKAQELTNGMITVEVKIF